MASYDPCMSFCALARRASKTKIRTLPYCPHVERFRRKHMRMHKAPLVSTKTCAAAHGSDTLCRILGSWLPDNFRSKPRMTTYHTPSRLARLDNTRYPVSQTNSYKFSPSFVESSSACAFRYIHGGATYIPRWLDIALRSAGCPALIPLLPPLARSA